MPIADDYLCDVWAFDAEGTKVFPYRGERGQKKGLFSVNFTNDTRKFVGMTEVDLCKSITDGRFRDRGTIRMLPLKVVPGVERNAFAPLYYKGRPVKSF
jgi:hypothetical protein